MVCAGLGIPHYVVDFSAEFRTDVIDVFTNEYLAGNTPNPCVICNRKIKWERFLEKAAALGAGFVAMGHYARVNELNGRWFISRGADRAKDQSYALWALSQQSLSRTLFPLGGFTKDQVRRLAGELRNLFYSG
jgi:tRNA-specific 2-thiouridylase